MDSPSAHRNKDPIWSIIESKVLPLLLKAENEDSPSPVPLNVLEIAAGCGVHTTHFVTKLAEKNISTRWHPTDPDPPSLVSLQERVNEFGLPDGVTADVIISKPFALCLGEEGVLEDKLNNENEGKSTISFHSGADKSMNLIMCINMIHISPWSATVGLFKVASQELTSGGVLVTYGPYKVNGAAAESNLNFDRNLKERNPAWGVRDLELVQSLAEQNGLSSVEVIEMPANNLCLIFRK